MASPAFLPVPEMEASEREHRRKLARKINDLLQGRLNCTLDVTLTANAASTTVTDARLSASSFIGVMPRTANAAAEIGAGTLYVSARANGSATLAHANNAQTDREYTLLIIG